MRNILHDWDQESCLSILKNIILALGTRSSILIDEIVLPEKVDRATRNAEVTAALDIVLMAAIAGCERTMVMWEELLSEVGLRIVEVRTYDRLGNSILVVRKDGM